MLPRKNRLQRSVLKDIGSGRSFSSGNFTLIKLPFNGSTEPRFSFSASKKVSKTAVGRNKIRRRGYAILHAMIPAIRDGFQARFLAKKGATAVQIAQMEAELRGLIEKAGGFRHKVEEGVKMR